MNRVFTRVASLALILTSTLNANAGETTMTNAQKAALTAVEHMTSAFQNGDINGVMQSYEPNAAVVFEPGKPTNDAAQLRAMFAAMAEIKPQFKYSGHDVHVAGDIALHIAPWDMTGTGPDGQEIKETGLSVSVLRKQADGTWKLVIDDPNGSHLMAD